MEVILIYAVIGAVFGVVAVLLYARARASRRGLRCPQCGEYVRIELMDADQRCTTCGTPLEVTGDTHAQP